MRKLWVFGDSFMAWNKNWVGWLAKKYGCRIHMHAVSGSSIDFTYLELLRWEHKINSRDYVLIGITGEHRHYFSGIHFVPNYLVLDGDGKIEVRVPHYPRKNEPLYNQVKTDAYVSYVKELYNLEHREKLVRATIYYITNVISKRLSTDNVLIIPTVYNPLLSGQETEKQLGRQMNIKSFWQFNEEFLIKKNLIRPKLDLEKAVELMDTPNHWLGDIHEDYEKEWHQFYDPIIDKYFTSTTEGTKPTII